MQHNNNFSHPPKEPRNWFSILAIAALALMGGKLMFDRFAPISNPASPENAIQWESDYEVALSQAETEEKEVLVRFSATWCPPCKVMTRKVWPDADVADAVTKDYIPLDLDIDDATAAQLASRYGVDSVPTILRLDSKGQVKARANYMGSSQALKFLADSGKN